MGHYPVRPTKPPKNLTVQQPEPPIECTVLAEAIVEISKAAKRLNESGLNRKAIVALIHDYSAMGKKDIGIVLDSLEALAEMYCQQ